VTTRALITQLQELDPQGRFTVRAYDGDEEAFVPITGFLVMGSEEGNITIDLQTDEP
jgi:hypothetical protein